MGPYGPHLAGWGWGWAFGLGSLIFWAVLAVAVVLLVRSFMHRGRQPMPPYPGYAGGPGPYGAPGPAGATAVPTPEQILAERFARGEIDEEEYRQRLAALRGQPPHPGPAAGSS